MHGKSHLMFTLVRKLKWVNVGWVVTYVNLQLVPITVIQLISFCYNSVNFLLLQLR